MRSRGAIGLCGIELYGCGFAAVAGLIADTDLYAQIDQWVRERPKSAAALAARAFCAAKIGWKLRGPKWARETPDHAFEGMYRSQAHSSRSERAPVRDAQLFGQGRRSLTKRQHALVTGIEVEKGRSVPERPTANDRN
ncbi:MAG: hypothetical protein WC809_00605 [Sinimarinibacterium sp.]|jgi:hypothetical protein